MLDNWWKNKRVIEQIVDWAQEIYAQHPHEKVISLGQSPAWVVQTVGMLRKLHGQPANIGFIPFTGAFLSRDFNSAAHEMKFLEGARPDIDRVHRYLDFLGRFGLQIQQLTQQGSKIVLAEMIKQGNGLASFLDVWTREVEDERLPELISQFEFYTFDTNPVLNKDMLKVAGRDTAFNLRRISLTTDEADLMEGITPHNLADVNSSRLVPMYKMAAHYEDRGLELIPNAHNKKVIKATLHAAAQTRFQSGAFNQRYE